MEDLRQKKLALKKKILAVAKMAHYFHTMREESEAVLHLKGLSPNGMMSTGMLERGLDSADASADSSIKKANITIADFDSAKKLDILNERMPTMKPTKK